MALVTRGRLQTDDNRLEDGCQRWITGIRAQFAGTPIVRQQPEAPPGVVQDGLNVTAPAARQAEWAGPDGGETEAIGGHVRAARKALA